MCPNPRVLCPPTNQRLLASERRGGPLSATPPPSPPLLVEVNRREGGRPASSNWNAVWGDILETPGIGERGGLGHTKLGGFQLSVNRSKGTECFWLKKHHHYLHLNNNFFYVYNKQYITPFLTIVLSDVATVFSWVFKTKTVRAIF